MTPAPMNAMAYSFVSIVLVSFVRSAGDVIKNRLSIQTAIKMKEKQPYASDRIKIKMI
jgi:hypothetical protein